MASALGRILLVTACAFLSAFDVGAAGPQAEADGVKAQIRGGQGKAGVTLTALGRYEMRVDVDPAGEREPLVVRVELPPSGPRTWPAEDVQVFDAKGRPLAVRHDGIEWHRLELRVPPTAAAYLIRAAGMPDPKSLPLPPESERTATDPASGLKAEICGWYGGRRAALSIRFDDSHPSHLATAMPILEEYGYRGTFMINPGAADYQSRKKDWESCARRGEHEFGNHTMRHRGAESDEEMEREIAEAAEYIRGLFPDRSKLLALNLGGGTSWVTTKSLRHYLDKHRLFNVSGSLGMDDVYGDRPGALRQHLARHLERELWCRIHFHSIGKEQSASEQNFRAALEVIKAQEADLWIAGLADAFKYQQERKAAGLSLSSVGPKGVALNLRCGTDPALFDQPLTIALTLPAGWVSDKLTVSRPDGSGVRTIRPEAAPQGRVVRFDVPPTEATYVVKAGTP